MRDFFRPFRRQRGVLTLGVACLCTAMWLRSFGVADVIQFQTDTVYREVSRITMMSAGRGVYWQQIVGGLDPRPNVEWVSVDVDGFDVTRDMYCRLEWKLDYLGFQIEEGIRSTAIFQCRKNSDLDRSLLAGCDPLYHPLRMAVENQAPDTS